MKKSVSLGLLVLAFIGILAAGILFLGVDKAQECLNRHSGNFLGCLVAGPVALSVQVTGQVDEVLFYSLEDSSSPVAAIVTNGRDVTQTLQLPTHSAYYFVVRKGEQTYTGKPTGFWTSQTSARLKIHDLDRWEGY